MTERIKSLLEKLEPELKDEAEQVIRDLQGSAWYWQDRYGKLHRAVSGALASQSQSV
jgi:hypothetical protein